MENTNLLKIILENKFSENEVAIHPNDGEALDLYTLDHNMMFYTGQSIDKFKGGEGGQGEGVLHLLNECRMGTLMVSRVISEKLNYSQEAIVIRDKEKLFLAFR